MRKKDRPYENIYIAERRRRRRRVFFALFLLFGAGVAFAASYVFELDAWQKLDVTRITEVDQSLILYDGAGREFTTLHKSEDRIWIALEDMPLHTKNAFIAAEDARFYEHEGIDIVRIAGAAWADIKAGAYVQGASTISQQLIKLSHLTADKRMKRKLEEAVLAWQLERLYDKDEILEMYLNYVYFGGGYYGVEAAARGYFGVSAGELSVAQSAQLAGILKAPARYAPHLDPEASVGRRNLILSQMAEYGFISEETRLAARAEEAVILHGQRAEKRGYYVDLALTEACGLLGVDMDTLLSGGYRIHTYMDAALQAEAEAILADEENFPAGEDGSYPEAALTVVEVESGGVAALVGGRGAGTALGFNRATDIRRQPGSMIKPVIVYAPALEAGYTAATMLLDEQMDFSGYMPSNPGGQYDGWVTMREAVTRSLNVPAVAVMATVGVEGCKRFAESLGIAFDEQDTSLTLALGGFTYGVSPYMVAGAYAAFARGGVYCEPSVIRRITDANGTVLYERAPEGTRVMREANAYVLTSMLESVVSSGTGRSLAELGIPLAGKTGTTGDDNGNRDIWMAAYNPAYAAAVWIGYDDASDGRSLPESATGGSYPADIIGKLFRKLYPAGGAPDFVMPEGVRSYRIDSFTLEKQHVTVLANALTPEGAYYEEVFVSGTEPDLLTSYWQIPSPPETLSATVGGRSALIYFETPNRYMLYRLYRENSEGKAVLLGEFSGEDGSVAFTDDSIPEAGAYAYYVIAAHPQLSIDGQPLTGEASARAGVLIEE
ncbi:MAG: PBP1A family penicillin-binding protein [Clostridia bacterium]|nr:PBP1A family penicillin-binding protein [Clostridia bacterium]